MKQRSLRNKNDLGKLVRQIWRRMILWTLVVIVMLLQIKTTAAAKYNGDHCISKGQSGICKEWSECPVIKTLIESGEYTNVEVERCGFGVKEEIICCPIITTDQKVDTSPDDDKDRFTEPLATQAPAKDFWLDLLQNSTSTTTSVPDFWLELLNLNTTTTSTTSKPLIIREQRLNESSDFFDFNALLGGTQSDVSKQQRKPNLVATASINNNPSNQVLTTTNDFGPPSVNPWISHQTGNNFNNGRGSTNFNNGQNNFQRNQNGNGFLGQQSFNMGGNSFNNPGRGHVNGHGPNNNGIGRNGLGMGAQNHGFILPHNNMPPNNIFNKNQPQNNRPGGPVNNKQDQYLNNPFLNGSNRRQNIAQTPNSNDDKMTEFIKNVFENQNPANNQEKPHALTMEDTIANIFHVNKPQTPLNTAQQVKKVQTALWLTPQGTENNHRIEYVENHTPHQQMHLTSPQDSGYFEIIPVVDNHVVGNNLNQAPSMNYIQQPVIGSSWSGNDPVHGTNFSPEQAAYEKLINSGIDVVKAQVNHIKAGQQQFVQQPAPLNVLQSPQPMQQFVHHPQFVHQQGYVPQNFGQQVSLHSIQQPLQMESFSKGPRSASRNFSLSQQMIQQPLQWHTANKESGSALQLQPILHVQSPPTQIRDPFKPFEFRAPPADENTFSEDDNSLSTKPTSPRPNPTTNAERPAVRACRRIEKGLNASLSPHILGGTAAYWGEFPHMAAIGYSRVIGVNRPPYDIRCGGSLIDKRFVLTAAHCVSDIDSVPSIVRLGVVNFTDATQMEGTVELNIKETYIHDSYSTSSTYNDIAILELEREVQYSEFVYPVCLYTNKEDPNTNVDLWVTGWGTINTTLRTFSDILLKASLHTSPLENCNKSFNNYGLTRRIVEGVRLSQFCAEDKGRVKDACQGDSGGPLNLIVDESYKNYRLVGVISSGFGCAGSTPGLYTRVAAFLDYIEKIVWPNGGD